MYFPWPKTLASKYSAHLHEVACSKREDAGKFWQFKGG